MNWLWKNWMMADAYVKPQALHSTGRLACKDTGIVLVERFVAVAEEIG